MEYGNTASIGVGVAGIRIVSTKHTPGPWDVGAARKTMVMARTKTVLIADCGNVPQNFGTSQGETEANARLIAQAPAMLEALRKMQAAFVPQLGVKRTIKQKWEALAAYRTIREALEEEES